MFRLGHLPCKKIHYLQVCVQNRLADPSCRYLCDRDCKTFSALFELLDVQDYIRYEDFDSLTSKIMQIEVHLPEVRGMFRRSSPNVTFLPFANFHPDAWQPTRFLIGQSTHDRPEKGWNFFKRYPILNVCHVHETW